MHLPILHYASLEVLNRAGLPRNQWFHPLHNPWFRMGSGDTVMTDRGHVTMAYLRKLMTNLITEHNLKDILSEIIKLRLGESYIRTCLPFLKAYYDYLPDNLKHTIFMVSLDYPYETDSHTSLTMWFRFPYNCNDNMMSMDSVGIAFNFDNGMSYETAHLPATHTTAFDEDVPANHRQAWFNFDDMFVGWNTDPLPNLVRTVVGYLQNQKIYTDARDSGRRSNATPYKLYNEYLHNADALSINMVSGWPYFRSTVTDTNRSLIERVLNYSTNVLDYLPYSIKGPNEAANTCYGVELEACSDYSPKDVIAAQKALFFILKQDGSISGSKPNAYEMVTVPATLKAHKRLWAEFFSSIDYDKFDTTKDTGNGMHVHIDRKAFKPPHLNRFIWFITNPANRDFMFTISERPTKSNLNQWAPFPGYRMTNARHVECAHAYDRNHGLRGAVHLKGSKTVELRIFKGIVSYATIVKNLEFTDSVVEYTRHTTLVQISLGNYLAWLSSLPANRYQTLRTFLAEAKVEPLATNAMLEDFLFGTNSNPQVIYKRLLKAPFSVTNDHVTYLNKKFRKRTFILKQGVLQCLANSGGLLAKLDKSVQQKQLLAAKSFQLSRI